MTSKLFQEIIATYRRHGWRLRSVLLTPETRMLLKCGMRDFFAGAEIREAEFDGLWFARPSHAGREAWELRLVADQPYALFAAFESDEGEAEREQARGEMEARMRDYTTRHS